MARDLFLYNNQPGTVWGPAGEFLSAPRLDDLACVFACTQGFLTAHETTAIPVLCVFDNEEIGSETKQGAASAFLPETLTAITSALGLTSGDYRRLVANSFLLSCDNGHARHPNHPELADANEAPVLNGGVVVKHSPAMPPMPSPPPPSRRSAAGLRCPPSTMPTVPTRPAAPPWGTSPTPSCR